MQAAVNSSEAQKRVGIKVYAQTKYPEPALDSARFEAYLERQRRLKTTSQKGPHLKHWSVVDDVKFRAEYVIPVRNAVNALIALTADDAFVTAAIIQDIKAMAWHPVFELHKASYDSQKLQMIKQSCKEIYPIYSESAASALLHLNQEWQEHDEEIAAKQKPALEHGKWMSYQRKSIVAGPGGGLPHPNGTGGESTKEKKKDKQMAGVFSRIFRRRSIHHPEKIGGDKEAPRSMSVCDGSLRLYIIMN